VGGTEGPKERSRRRMAILGGGPVGLACLARARSEGWDARLFERGRIGENVRIWGHVRMFSPLNMNMLEPAAVERLSESEEATLLTGVEYVERCLEPLARQPELAPRIHSETEVVAISRDRLRKGDQIATGERGRQPFRLLLESPTGERMEEADVVVDATGTTRTHNWLGGGGIPAVGERQAEELVDHVLPDILGRERQRFRGRHTLVVGAGHSAATALIWLERLAREDPETRATWVTRSASSRPVTEIVEDVLVERARVSLFANDAAQHSGPWLTRIAGSVIVEVRREEDGVSAAVAAEETTRWIRAHRVLALVGYRPDLDLTRELQAQTCWATEGTYPLAAALLAREGQGGGDCLSAGNLGSHTLRHPEAGLFTLGAKSYGRNPNFLIRTGLEQVHALFELLHTRAA
jgi:thioredoxin reductase